MKQEYILAFEKNWYHFCLSPEQGLCVNKKQGARFYFAHSLLKNATADFCVARAEKSIHAVCQDKEGSIWHFVFDGTKWHSRVLLESREKTAKDKHLTLITNGEFVHLFYTISVKEQTMLIHHLLGEGATEPQATDYTKESFFSACGHKNGDVTLLYKNADGVLGTRCYRWSKKAFEPFVPLDCGCDLNDAVLLADEDDTLKICAYATFDKFVNILFVKKDVYKNECTLAALHLVSGISEGLTLSKIEGILRISWRENGLVMTTKSVEDNKWSAPKKYIRSTSCENVLYHIESETEDFSTYGYMQDAKITLYNSHDILDLPPRSDAITKDAKDPFGKSPSFKNNLFEPKPPEFVKRSVYLTDMAAVRKLLAGQNDVVVEMLKKISALEEAMREKEALLNQLTKNISPESLVENPDQIDRLAAENL